MQSNKSLAFARLLHFKYTQQRLNHRSNRCATDGVRPNNASIVACKLFDLQGEFKFGVRKKRKNTNKVRAYLFVVRSTQNKWVLTHLVRCTDTACLFVCYVRCARFLQMLCACSSLCLRSTETCSEQSERNSGTGEYYSPK